ncbi:MAG: T9SS C-terminal target domain-containing protein, partial [Cryomorphaceae bacterium]
HAGNVQSDLLFSIHPNPTNAHLTLSGSALLPGSELKVYNLAGQQVYSEVLQNAHETHTLDARRFGPAGMYLLHLNTPGRTPVVKKVVVQE